MFQFYGNQMMHHQQPQYMMTQHQQPLDTMMQHQQPLDMMMAPVPDGGQTYELMNGQEGDLRREVEAFPSTPLPPTVQLTEEQLKIRTAKLAKLKDMYMLVRSRPSTMVEVGGEVESASDAAVAQQPTNTNNRRSRQTQAQTSFQAAVAHRLKRLRRQFNNNTRCKCVMLWLQLNNKNTRCKCIIRKGICVGRCRRRLCPDQEDKRE